MKYFKIKKTDGRHTGSEHWRYYIEMPGTKPQVDGWKLFCDWREWCWNTWGSSKELNHFGTYDLFDGKHCSNPKWCWINDEHRTRLYFKGEEEVTAFTFRWGL